MRAPRGIAVLRGLQEQPLWRLLRADKATIVIPLLAELLLESDKRLSASVLIERLARGLEEVRALGEDMPQSAQGYVADWLAQGWLVRRLAQGASEEEYELSSDAAHAIRFALSLRARRTLATESRLASVMQQLLTLVEETDANPETRIASLVAERERIDREILSVRTRGVTPMSEARAVERAREIIALADELTSDFRRVRDDFDELNRGLRQSLIENDGSRGEVLEQLFAGVDLIGESDAGKSFSAFWRLLTNPEQSEALREAIDTLAKRAFMRKLAPGERRFLLNLTALLTDEGSNVHDVLQSFARSLKSFVQSREFMEQRRLTSLLKQATQAALAARDVLKPTDELQYELVLTSSRIRSVSQGALYDPADRVSDCTMNDLDPSEMDPSLVGDLMQRAEIDFRTLRGNLRTALDHQPYVTIAQVLARFPAEQGLGSVVGYVALGAKHGEPTQEVEAVTWRGHDDVLRRAKVPVVRFSRERYDELMD